MKTFISHIVSENHFHFVSVGVFTKKAANTHKKSMLELYMKTSLTLLSQMGNSSFYFDAFTFFVRALIFHSEDLPRATKMNCCHSHKAQDFGT
jgi:hypothetical protein